MSNMDGTPTLMSYGDVPQDDTVPGLAQSLDAAIDAAGDAFAAGQPDQAAALIGAADVVSDALLDALGVPDADEDGTNG